MRGQVTLTLGLRIPTVTLRRGVSRLECKKQATDCLLTSRRWSLLAFLLWKEIKPGQLVSRHHAPGKQTTYPMRLHVGLAVKSQRRQVVFFRASLARDARAI